MPARQGTWGAVPAGSSVQLHRLPRPAPPRPAPRRRPAPPARRSHLLVLLHGGHVGNRLHVLRRLVDHLRHGCCPSCIGGGRGVEGLGLRCRGRRRLEGGPLGAELRRGSGRDDTTCRCTPGPRPPPPAANPYRPRLRGAAPGARTPRWAQFRAQCRGAAVPLAGGPTLTPTALKWPP